MRLRRTRPTARSRPRHRSGIRSPPAPPVMPPLPTTPRPPLSPATPPPPVQPGYGPACLSTRLRRLPERGVSRPPRLAPPVRWLSPHSSAASAGLVLIWAIIPVLASIARRHHGAHGARTDQAPTRRSAGVGLAIAGLILGYAVVAIGGVHDRQHHHQLPVRRRCSPCRSCSRAESPNGTPGGLHRRRLETS